MSESTTNVSIAGSPGLTSTSGGRVIVLNSTVPVTVT
jgi:hypothetical protein